MPDVWINVIPLAVFCPFHCLYKEQNLTQQSHYVALCWLLLVTKDAKEFAEKMDDSELVISDVEVDVDDDPHTASHLTNCRTNESKPLDYPLRRSELHSTDLRFSSKERPRTKDAREAKDNARDRPLLRTQSSASPESFNGQLFMTGLTSLWKLLP